MNGSRDGIAHEPSACDDIPTSLTEISQGRLDRGTDLGVVVDRMETRAP